MSTSKVDSFLSNLQLLAISPHITATLSSWEMMRLKLFAFSPKVTAHH